MRQFFIFKTHIIMTTQELRAYRANLRTWYKRATPEEIASGMIWYSEAQVFSHGLAKKYCLLSFISAGVLSILSVNNKWPRNKIDAEAVIVAWLAGATPEQVKVCTYTTSLSAKDCKTSITSKQYKEIERETAKVAHEYGLKGYEFQAIVWVTIRNRWMNN